MQYYVLGFTAADRANSGSYEALADKLRSLEARCADACADSADAAPGQCSSCRLRRVAYREACAYKEAMASKLLCMGRAWVLGTEYVALWRQVHRAEEALIMVEPREAVIAGAGYDELRCGGSTIENREQLKSLAEAAVRFLRSLPAGRHDHSSGPVSGFSEVVSPEETDGGPQSEAEARAILRRVRHSINEFRSDRWAGLVRARNLLCVAMGLMGLAAYSLLWLAVLEGASAPAIGAATAIFAIGAMLGLFSQCYRDAQTETVVDDYGLSLARLTATPLISGVAAVGGVLAVSLLSVSQVPNGEQAAAATVNGLFDIRQLPFNVLVAATFGLTPGLLLDRLQQQTEKYKTDLQTSEAADSSKKG